MLQTLVPSLVGFATTIAIALLARRFADSAGHALMINAAAIFLGLQVTRFLRRRARAGD